MPFSTEALETLKLEKISFDQNRGNAPLKPQSQQESVKKREH